MGRTFCFECRSDGDLPSPRTDSGPFRKRLRNPFFPYDPTVVLTREE